MNKIPGFEPYFATTDGSVWRNNKRRATAIKRSGYVEIILSVHGKVYYRLVHRLIWEAFNGAIPAGHHVNHIDGDKTNNALINLECMSPEENYAHSKAHLVRRGSAVNTAKLNERSVLEIRDLHARGMATKDIAKQFDVHPSSINRIVSKKNWSHL